MPFAFVFPGQGSQSVGMMSAYGDSPIVRETFDAASRVLSQDLWELVANGPEEELAKTINTQPVMLTAAIAVYRLWGEKGGKEPAVLAGHSLGEYSALVAAGAIAFESAVSLVRFRAEAMQQAVPVGVGAMAAIMGLDAGKIAAICAAVSDGAIVEPVNFNGQQIVIAGHQEAVERAVARCKEEGAKLAKLLPVSAPFHSSLMKPAAEALAGCAQDGGVREDHILPTLEEPEVAVRVAVATGLAAQAEGVARRPGTAAELEARARTAITAAQRLALSW